MKLKDEILNDGPVQRKLDILRARPLSECDRHTEIVYLDNWNCFICNESNFFKALDELNNDQDEFTFKFSGNQWCPDLLITSRKLKNAYNEIPKTKTNRDFIETLQNKYNVQSDLGMHMDLDEKITDEEYSDRLKEFDLFFKKRKEMLEEIGFQKED